MIFRVFVLLILGCSIAAGQKPSCSSLVLKVTRAPDRPTTIVWRVFVKNKTDRAVTLRVSAQGFQWTIERAEQGNWNVVLTGGVGPGMSSAGAKPTRNMDTHTVRRGHTYLIGDFDLRRDAPQNEALGRKLAYRITFAQEVELNHPKGRGAKCKLVANPQVFRADAISK